MAELIVVACHGPEWIDQCRASLKDHAPDANVVFVDTGGTIEHGADVAIAGGHPTGALLWVLEQYAAFDHFLLMQDSMTALADPLPWFREQDEDGAVAWGRFPMQWDSGEQCRAVEEQYPEVHPTFGIFGPVFYASREALAKVTPPKVPTTRLEAQGTERAWAYAFAAAGLPVAGPVWDPDAMKTGFGPFRKVFAGRP